MSCSACKMRNCYKRRNLELAGEEAGRIIVLLQVAKASRSTHQLPTFTDLITLQIDNEDVHLEVHKKEYIYWQLANAQQTLLQQVQLTGPAKEVP